MYQIVKKKHGIWKFSSFYCCIRLVSHLRSLCRFYHSRAIRTWSVCNELYHNVFRYEYLTFQTQIHLHKQYIFGTNVIQSEYAFLFPFSIYKYVRLISVIVISCRRFVIKFWCFSACLEDFLYTTMNSLLPYYTKIVKSYVQVVQTRRTDVPEFRFTDLMVQILQTHPIITYIMFATCKIHFSVL